MKFRRRLFLTTLVLGGGIWAFQPILRSRIEHRLSETLGVQVDVGSSKVSLIDATISLSDIVIHSKKAEASDNNSAALQTKIAHAALRFDWNSAAYRNLKIENLLATGVHWAVDTPSIQEVPMAASKNPVDDMKSLLAEASVDNNLARFDVLIQPLKRRIADESSKQSQTHMEISSRLKSIGERLREAFPSESSPNPLRQRSVVDDVKKEMAMIRQAIAEDRINRKDADKTLASLKLSSKQGVLECASETDPTSEAKVQLAAQSLAKAAIAHDWNENRAVVHAVLQSMAALESSPVVADPVADAPRFNRERTHPIESLPSRFTQIDSARLRGTARFESSSTPRARSSFDMRLKNISSKTESNESRPMVTLAITPGAENGSGNPILCAAERVAIPQSELSQIQMRLERTLNSYAKSTSHIQQASHGWSSTVSFPLAECIRHHCSDISELNSALTNVDDSAKIRARLVGTTQSLAGQHTELSIEVEPESLKSLETAISSLGQKQLARRRHFLETRGNALVDSELLNIESRWEQLGDEHARTHSSWEADLTSLNEQVQRVESANKRLSRQNSPLQR